MSIAELIIGLSLVILLVGIVIPKADSGYMKAEWERRRICSELRYLKRRNLAGIEEYMWIENINGKTCYSTSFESKVIKQEYIDKDIKVYNNIQIIKFRENGTPLYSGTIEAAYKNKMYTITITPISGRILFKEGIYSNDKK